MAASEATTAQGAGGHAPEGASRRDFLNLVTLTTAAVGVGAVVWPFIDYMDPAQDTIAAGQPVDIDISQIQPGQQIVLLWREKPILVVNRTPAALKELQSKSMIDRLSDPNSKLLQQPKYADNWHRSIKPEYSVLVGICTHLGCLPIYYPDPSKNMPVADWPGGYFCPCHGSKYDLAGRVWKGVPAPYNLPVPPYNFVNDKTVRIGENPPNVSYSLGDIVQI
jgi:ubiquinol-cytochrome c reductase iron-sulfur subunit